MEQRRRYSRGTFPFKRLFGRRFKQLLCLFAVYASVILVVIYIAHYLQVPGFAAISNKNSYLLNYWRHQTVELCPSAKGEHKPKLMGYNSDFMHLSNVLVNKEKFVGKRKGGEELQEVLGQPEKLEYYEIQQNAFQIHCKGYNQLNHSSYPFISHTRQPNYLNNFFHSLNFVSDSSSMERAKQYTPEDNLVIVVTRREYSNLYHVLTEWYNAYLMMKFFNHTSHTTDVLFIDAHPSSTLDQVWTQMFHSVVRLSQLNDHVLFNEMVWSIQGYNSPISHLSALRRVPLLEDFRVFFFHQHNITTNINRKLPCDKVNILIILRHDYIAHPRNPKGKIPRKFAREKELVTHLQKRYPRFAVNAIQIDSLQMVDQLKVVAETDILIGVHGSGLSHAVFLPPKSAVIEILSHSTSEANIHFRRLAELRNLVYIRYKSEFPDVEVKGDIHRRVLLQSEVAERLVEQALTRLSCIHKWNQY